jgi:hypothetical protein
MSEPRGSTKPVPTGSQVKALAEIGWLALRGRHRDAVETLLRSAYTYRDGRSAWDAFPEEWRRIARENAKAALADFRARGNERRGRPRFTRRGVEPGNRRGCSTSRN